MSTRSLICYKHNNGRVTGVYCHFDGYISHVGLLLYLFYNTPQKVKELLQLGELQSLGESIGVKYDLTKRNNDMKYAKKIEPIVKHQCTAYHRDGLEDLKIYHFSNIQEAKNFFVSYKYFFINNEWYVCDSDKICLVKLESLLAEDTEVREKIKFIYSDDNLSISQKIVYHKFYQQIGVIK